MKKIIILSVLAIVIVSSLSFAQGIKSSCGHYLNSAMDYGVRLQKAKEERKQVEQRVLQAEEKLRSVEEYYSQKMRTSRNTPELMSQRDQALNNARQRVDIERRYLENIDRRIQTDQSTYDNKSNEFANCVERYKENLRVKRERARTPSERREIEDQIGDSNKWVDYALDLIKIR